MSLAHTLFDGLSFVVDPEHDNTSTIAIIRSFEAVNKIWPTRLYKRPDVIVDSTFTSAKVESAAKLKKRDLEDDYVVHVQGGVDKLREEGYNGDGYFIAIVGELRFRVQIITLDVADESGTDTGVDYNHPALGGGFGPGFKFAHGYDLVGDDYDGTAAPVPDDDPMDCLGHGTRIHYFLNL